MSSRTLYFLSFFSLCFLTVSSGFAQQPIDSFRTQVIDTTHPITSDIHKEETENAGKSILSEDSSISRKFDPKKATLRSLILPGWGQAYNKKYWKIPIVYGALGTTTGVFLYNMKTYKLLRKAVNYKMSPDPNDDLLIDPQFKNLSLESLRIYRNSFRQNIDYSVLVFLVFWGVNVVDATVDAHLKAFDVSSDISVKFKPDFNSATNSPGASLVFFFKDKSAKPLMPLP